jgi:beta-glucosidase-like glycosyl hydrolase
MEPHHHWQRGNKVVNSNKHFYGNSRQEINKHIKQLPPEEQEQLANQTILSTTV